MDALPGGRNQPFYHVLADRRNVPESDASKLRYVAQELIEPTDLCTIEHDYFNEESFVDGARRLLPTHDAACASRPRLTSPPHVPASPCAVDEERGLWTPSPSLREQYPLGVDGCWLVETVFPDRSRTDFDV